MTHIFKAPWTIPFCAGLIVAGCSVEKPPQPQQKAGWASRGEQILLYRYNDKLPATFFAGCDDSDYSTFAVMDPDGAGNAESFTLIIDNQSWELERHIYLPHGGGHMMAIGPEFDEAFANAKRIVSFRTKSGWERSFKPAPKLAEFIAKCRAKRKARADAERGLLSEGRSN